MSYIAVQTFPKPNGLVWILSRTMSLDRFHEYAGPGLSCDLDTHFIYFEIPAIGPLVSIKSAANPVLRYVSPSAVQLSPAEMSV